MTIFDADGRIRKWAILDALEQCEGNITHAADLLNTNRNTIYRRLRPHERIPGQRRKNLMKQAAAPAHHHQFQARPAKDKSMPELIIVQQGQAFASSLAIAEGVGYPHKSVIRLIRDNQADLEEFGLLRFENAPRPVGQHGGGGIEYALLNEQQATLLMTYMRNNDVVRGFKKRLVRAFYELKAEALRLSQQSSQKLATPTLPQADTIKQITAAAGMMPSIVRALCAAGLDKQTAGKRANQMILQATGINLLGN